MSPLKNIYVLCPFFNWVIYFLLNCLSSLYILDIKSLLDVWFTNIPSHSIGCLFTLLFFFFNLFLAMLGLHCCEQAFSSCSKQGLLFVAVCGLLIAVVSLAAEHGL